MSVTEQSACSSRWDGPTGYWTANLLSFVCVYRSEFGGRPPSARGYRPPSGTGMRPASGARGRMAPPSCILAAVSFLDCS